MFNASMNFALGEEIESLRDIVHRWAQERVAPMAAEIDSSNCFPPELWLEMGELGLLGVTVSCLLYTSPSPRDRQKSRMPSSA